jgi:hypothetical protein
MYWDHEFICTPKNVCIIIVEKEMEKPLMRDSARYVLLGKKKGRR